MNKPKLGQTVYIAFGDWICKDKVLMVGENSFACHMQFDSAVFNLFRRPIMFDEYGVAWFNTLEDAKKSIVLEAGQRIVKHSDEYWEVEWIE